MSAIGCEFNRSAQPVRNLPLGKFGEPIIPNQVRKRFGFGQAQNFGKRKLVATLPLTQ